MNEERIRRLGDNERLFREVNERINRIQDDFGHAHVFEIVCECAGPECTARIEITHDAYRELRASQVTFAVVPGHQDEELEDVVERTESYYVVRKREGLPAQVARGEA